MKITTMDYGFPRPVSTKDELSADETRAELSAMGIEYRGLGWYSTEEGIYLVLPTLHSVSSMSVSFFSQDPRVILGAIARVPDRSLIQLPELIVRSWPSVAKAAAEIRQSYRSRLAVRETESSVDDRMLRVLEKMAGTPFLVEDLPADAPLHVFADEQCIDSGASDHFHFKDFTVNLFLTSEVRQAEQAAGVKIDDTYLRMVVAAGSPEHTIVIYPEMWRKNARCGTMQQARGDQNRGG